MLYPKERLDDLNPPLTDRSLHWLNNAIVRTESATPC
jgi:hypothetical protein